MNSLFYKPRDAWAADFIPFHQDGQFRLFYLLDWRDPAGHGEGTPWFRIDTADFLSFTEAGEMLPRGTAEEQDLYVFTGSVIEAGGLFHIFYTGHNPHFRRAGRPEQAVMHAVSRDLTRWEKVPEDTFFAPAEGYEPHDWRDPFIFWNEEAGEYWMLLAARLTSGLPRRRGCTALCASRDLKTWETRPPLWAPGLYFTHECPDLFRIGDWWYLIFSEFSERSVTRYRMSRSLPGPWVAPTEDTFDGRAFYAAKTAADGERRYLFGWIATREGERDDGPWQWGGHLAVHELAQEPDGTLSVRAPDSLSRALGRPMPLALRPLVGAWEIGGDGAGTEARDTFACAAAGSLPETARLTASVTFQEGTRGCGLVLRASDDFDSAYYIRLEPHRQRLVLDLWPRPGDRPHMVELERPLELRPGQPVRLEVFLDGTVCVVYAGGKVAMSARLYNLRGPDWGLFATEGAVRFDGLSLSTR